MDCNFTLEHYMEILQLAKKNGYEVRRLIDVARRGHDDAKVITMRHDIDFNFVNPFRLGKLEHENGFSSTFFVRMHADSYNTLSYRNLKILNELSSMGHEIGLHFENMFSGGEKIRMIKLLKETLEKCGNIKISGMAPHDSNRGGEMHTALTKEELHECGMVYDAISDIFTKGMKYISDSAGRWREGCACNFIRENTPKLCVLTHPIWWFDKTPAENY